VKIIDFGVDFVARNANKLLKMGACKEKLVEPSMCSHLGQCWAQATLVVKEERKSKRLMACEIAIFTN